MDDLNYLNVLLIELPSGRPLTTFDTKRTLSKCSVRQRQYAVVANAGQRFAIEVQVQSGFVWAGCNGLEVKIGFDVGEEVNCRSIYILKEQSTFPDLDLPHLVLQDGVYMHRIEHLLIENPNCASYNACHAQFYFQRLRPDDENVGKGLPRTFDSQGKIRVEISRTIISCRDQDRGLQADVAPGFRRQKRAKILKRGITLEVVLRSDPENATTWYRGNFKSDRPIYRNQQANFNFIYREDGWHDAGIASSDIVEVHTFRQSSSVVEDKVETRASPPHELKSLRRAESESQPTDSVGSGPTFDGQQDSDDMQLDLELTNTVRGASNEALFLPDLSSQAEAFLQTLDLAAISAGGQHQPGPTTRESSPTRDAIAIADPVPHAIKVDPSTGSLEEDAAEILRLIRAQSERQTSRGQELLLIEIKIRDVELQQSDSRQRIKHLQQEMDDLNFRSAGLDECRQDLEDQREQVLQSNRESKARLKRAMDNFRDVVREVVDHDVQTSSSRKRKRSEGMH